LRDLFTADPHELAHNLAPHEPRWLSDGLSEYVAVDFARKQMRPVWHYSILRRMPEVAFLKRGAELASWAEFGKVEKEHELYGAALYVVTRAAERDPTGFRALIRRAADLSGASLAARISSMAGLSLDSPPDTASVCSGFETTATKALDDGSPYASEYVRGTFSYFLKQGICPDVARAWLEKLKEKEKEKGGRPRAQS
ncbi:MAG: hypothetical protein DMF49_09440, partial [Acidobacteria bacterium]